jgi:tRNA threonylcarbamoyladenosine biosynthesis protein TsaE
VISGHIQLPDESAMAALADALLRSPRPLAVALRGPLGAGKTTLARSLLRALGHTGPVRSPTYTLVECYPIGPEAAAARVWHLDLYRLGSSEEVDWLGLDEYERARDWLLVEWPDRGAGHLPAFDLQLALDYAEPGRMLRWQAVEPDVAELLAQVEGQGRCEGPGLRAQGPEERRTRS